MGDRREIQLHLVLQTFCTEKKGEIVENYGTELNKNKNKVIAN